MLQIALIVAGLVLLLRDGVPWVGAMVTGTIYTRGTRRERIDRREAPERFKALAEQRFRGMAPGLLCWAGALAMAVWASIVAAL